MPFRVKTKIKLDKQTKDWLTKERDRKLERAIEKSAKALVRSIKEGITKAAKRTGRTYLITLPSGRRKKHTASARGEPPAILTRRLLNSVRAIKVSRFSWRVVANAPYAGYLDAPDYLDRPFFNTKVEAHVEAHLKIIEDVMADK